MWQASETLSHKNHQITAKKWSNQDSDLNTSSVCQTTLWGKKTAPLYLCNSFVKTLYSEIIITNSKSTTRFLSLRWTSYAASKRPKGWSKTQNNRFSYKSRLFSKNVCYKVSLCENCQRQSCKAFTGLSNRAQMVCGDVPLNVHFVHKDTHHCSGSECHRWRHWAVSVASILLQITPDLLSKKPRKIQIKIRLNISAKTDLCRSTVSLRKLSYLLCKIANRQRDRQTDRQKNICWAVSIT